MRSYFLILTITLTGCLNFLKAQNVYIPDSAFKAALVNDTLINTNGDTAIQVSEAVSYSGRINVSGLGIADLTGISAFMGIDSLNCSFNFLTSLDLSANTALTYLNCGYNQLITLNVSTNIALTSLRCLGNQITSLDVSSNSALTYLSCQYNHLTSLNVSSNTALTKLYCNTNFITSLDVSANTALNYLVCCQNQLSSLDVTANLALMDLECHINQLTNLDVSANVYLMSLYCGQNQLSSLNVSANTYLYYLHCNNNQLTSLDVTSNTALYNLNCSHNQLTNLNFTSNTALEAIWCNNNQLSGLDVSANTALTFLESGNNQLTNLNIQNGHNTLLINFAANGNPNLTCIQVDSVAYANSIVNWVKDSIASYSTNCNYPPTNCYAHFTMSPDTVPQTWYALNQCTGNGIINYVWNWGDGTPNDSTTNPSHTYSTAGYYNICVSITDSIDCTNSYCDSSVYINKSIVNAVINVNVVNQLPSYINAGLETPSKANFSIYPNPTSTTLNIQTTKSNNSNVKIFDAIGQLCLDEKLTNKNTSFNIQHLQSGIYFIKVGDTMQKFVKE